MTLLEAHRKIRELRQAIVKTTDVAARLQIRRNHAAKVLARLADHGVAIRLCRGQWAIAEQIDRLEIPGRLTAPSPSYVSLQTALFYHGLISQIPEVTYAVTTGKTRRYETPLGAISIHHLEPEFFFGFESRGEKWIKMATPEKALLDFLYLSQARSRLFTLLPEVELPKSFSVKAARDMISRIPFAARRTRVRDRFEELVERRRTAPNRAALPV